MSRARLLNLRYAAISYQSGSFCPQYLASAMAEFGVNFATFEALSADTLEMLHASLKWGWRQGDNSSGSSEESNEPLISCPQSVMQEIGKSSVESSSEAGTSQQPPGDSHQGTMLCALFARLSSWPSLESSDSEDHHHGETDVETTSTTVGSTCAARQNRKTSSVGSRRAKAFHEGEATEGREPGKEHWKIEPNLIITPTIPASYSISQEWPFSFSGVVRTRWDSHKHLLAKEETAIRNDRFLMSFFLYYESASKYVAKSKTRDFLTTRITNMESIPPRITKLSKISYW